MFVFSCGRTHLSADCSRHVPVPKCGNTREALQCCVCRTFSGCVHIEVLYPNAIHACISDIVVNSHTQFCRKRPSAVYSIHYILVMGKLNICFTQAAYLLNLLVFWVTILHLKLFFFIAIIIIHCCKMHNIKLSVCILYLYHESHYHVTQLV